MAQFAIESAGDFGLPTTNNFNWEDQAWNIGSAKWRGTNAGSLDSSYPEWMKEDTKWRTDPYGLWTEYIDPITGTSAWQGTGTQQLNSSLSINPNVDRARLKRAEGMWLAQQAKNGSPWAMDLLKQLSQDESAGAIFDAYGGERPSTKPYNTWHVNPFNMYNAANEYMSPYKAYNSASDSGFWKVFDKVAPVLATAAVLGPAAYGAMTAAPAAAAAPAAVTPYSAAGTMAAASMPGTLPAAVNAALAGGMTLGDAMGVGAGLGGFFSGGTGVDSFLGGAGRDVLLGDTGYGVGMVPPTESTLADSFLGEAFSGGEGVDVLAGQGADSLMEAAMGGNVPWYQELWNKLTSPLGNLGSNALQTALKLGSAAMGNNAARDAQNQLMDYLSKQQAAADPFADQRGIYQDLLKKSYLDPLGLYNSAEYQGLKDQYLESIRRRDAARGRNTANELPRAMELQDHFMNWLNSYRQGLQNPAGTTISPNNVGTLGNLFSGALQNRVNAMGGYTNALGSFFDPYANSRQMLNDRISNLFSKLEGTV